MKQIAVLMMILVFSTPWAYAGEADVTAVKITREGGRQYRFDVSVQHADTGWSHYADKWEVLSPDGDVLGVRTLLHPHVKEQPFTRSLSGVKVPPSIRQVIVRAHDSVHGYGGKELRVDLPKD
jgi:hypothetical protein